MQKWRLILKQVDALDKILPAILTLFTGKSRYLPEIVWSQKSWTHNIFRFYELLFWRREGIRAESSSKAYLENGKLIVKYEFFTFESVCAHLETLIRKFFQAKWVSIEVYDLQFAFPLNTPQLRIPLISFAIALDVANTGTATATSPLTWSHTVTGTSPLIAIGSGVQGTSVPTTTAVSYNSISATKARADTGTGSASGAIESSVWLKGNSSTGANTVSVSFTGGTLCEAGAVSYSGAQSSSTADAVNGTSANTSGSKSFNITPVAINCWLFATGAVRGTSPSFSTSVQTSRWSATFSSFNCQVGQDTNGPHTTIGPVTMGWITAGSGTSFCVALSGASFAPAPIANAITLSETVAISDALPKKTSLLFSETLTLTDTFLKSVQKVFAESITLSDTLIKQTTKLLTETLNISDTLSRLTSRLFSETVAVTDSLLKQAHKLLSELLTMTDALTSSHVFNVVLSEVIIVTDTFTKLTSKFFTETLTISDTLNRLTTKLFLESLTLTDALTAVLTHAGTAAKNYYSGGISAAKRMFRGIGF